MRFSLGIRLGAGILLAGPMPILLHADAMGQIPYTVFDENTQVRSLGFRFPAGRTFDDGRLEEQIVLTDRGGLHGIRSTLAFLPFVSAPGPHPFSPLDLQHDVARLRRFYSDAGFLGTEIRYDVRYDRESNVVDVDFVIEEGRATIVRSIMVDGGQGGDPARHLPAEMHNGWRGVVEKVVADTGRRYMQIERIRHENVILEWWRDRGWAFVLVRTDARIDSAAADAELRIAVTPGPRARVGSITIEGERTVSEAVVRRTLPFKEGDWYSARAITEGQRRLFGLTLFRLALIDVDRDPAQDSVANLRVRVAENELRLVTGELGYVSGGGLSVQGEFAHRNFAGGARTLRVTAVAETGLLAAGEPQREYRLAVAYRAPWFFHPRLSFSVSPFGHYRDDVTDRSWQAGLETSLVYELGAYRLVTLQHRYSTRRVLDFRLGSGSALDLVELLRLIAEGSLDSAGRRINRSTLSLSGTLGRFDPTRPANAVQLRPSIEITAPARLNTVEYLAIDVPALFFRPLGNRIAIAARVGIGRVFPFGKTIRGDSVAGLLEALQLRDVLLTAGGTGSVRGWGEGLLGPKFVNLRFAPTADPDSLEVTPGGYAPRGGLSRASASIELLLPFPGLGDTWGTHVFLDAGRVWTPDTRFQTPDPFHESGWFFGAGAGVEARTLIGPVRIALGWKLNPSPLDLRDSEEVFAALSRDLPISVVPTDWKRRLHLHVSLGQSF
jgi:outer membrane protein insertion porin family